MKTRLTIPRTTWIFAGCLIFIVSLHLSHPEARVRPESSLPRPWASQDVGSVQVAGRASCADERFTLQGTLDIWGNSDGFHFVHQPFTGDGQIIARITQVENTNDHAKAGVMFREDLAPGARHATVVVTPTDGVQFLRRLAPGDITYPNNPRINKGRLPYWVKLVRRGDQFTGYESTDGMSWEFTGSDTITMGRSILVGLVASSHRKDVLSTSTLDQVKLAPNPAGTSVLNSHVTIMSVDGKDKRVVFSAARRFEAPNWSHDGEYLLVNSEGKLWRIPVAGGEPQNISLGSIGAINNDHGISPDGKLLAVSVNSGPIFVLPVSGGQARQVTEHKPSYFHGWSPDGRELAYVARQHESYDIFSIPLEGGTAKRLTINPAHEDGPDFSPDGKWIYYNSDRAGGGDIWRIPAQGAGEGDSKAEQVTSDDYVDWFPHPSPDGKWLLFLSYRKGTQGHPANQNVLLRIMPLPGDKMDRPAGAKTLELGKLFGGQGTINVASWSPDSRRFAFVSYSFSEP
jgi:Tol biopolymer transport system component